MNASSKTVSIGAGESLSASLDLQDRNLCGLVIPAGWDAAAITFKGSIDNANFYDIYDEYGVEVEAAVTAGKICSFKDYLPFFLGINYVKFRSGTSASAVNQEDAVTLTALLGKVT